jgi:hypothetical protein
MRTTVTLDPDVASKLRQTARDRGISFKEALNTAIRRGFQSAEAKSQPYRVPTRNLGVKPGVNLDKALQLTGEIEDAETLRKLQLRK